MRTIHVIGAQETNYPWGIENRVLEALRALGYEVISTDFRKRRAELPGLIRRPADLVLVCKGEGIPPEVIRSAPCPTALWYAEQIGTRTHSDEAANLRRRELGYNVRAYDCVFTHDAANVDVYRALGARSVSWLATAAVDPAVHRKLDIPKSRGVVFAGSMTPRRARMLDAIREAGIEVEVLNLWDPHELNAAFNEAKIVLNLHLSDLPNTETRIAEVLGAGSLLISEEISSPGLIRGGEHCILCAAGDVAGIAGAVRHYLDHDVEREEIAARGHRHMHTNHSFRRRMEEVVSVIEVAPAHSTVPSAAPVRPAQSPGVMYDIHGRQTTDYEAYAAAVAAMLRSERIID